MCENGGVKMAAVKKTLLVPSSSAPGAAGGGIRISITNQHGRRYRYRASAVSLNLRKGALQDVENDGRCFVWFDRCDLEVRDTRRTVLFKLKAGAASNQSGTEIVILAELVAPTPRARARRSMPLPIVPRRRAKTFSPSRH